jgi:CrcB protein
VTILLVALAGAGGVLLRYGISSGFHGDALPWVTVAINVLGSFLLGLIVVAHWASPQTRTVLGVGFLGGFTTFSTFSVQAFLDVEAGEPGRAVLYVLASVLVGFAAAAAGYYLGRAVQ